MPKEIGLNDIFQSNVKYEVQVDIPQELLPATVTRQVQITYVSDALKRLGMRFESVAFVTESRLRITFFGNGRSTARDLNFALNGEYNSTPGLMVNMPVRLIRVLEYEEVAAPPSGGGDPLSEAIAFLEGLSKSTLFWVGFIGAFFITGKSTPFKFSFSRRSGGGGRKKAMTRSEDHVSKAARSLGFRSKSEMPEHLRRAIERAR